MKSLSILVVFGVIAGGAYWGFQYMKAAKDQQPQAEPTAVAEREAEPAAKYPVPEQPASQTGGAPSGAARSGAVPPLDESDQSLEGALANLFGAKSYTSVFQLDELIRRIVVTVDSAGGTSQAAEDVSVFRPLETEFLVDGKPGAQTIGAGNAARYAPYLELVRALDVEKFATLYVRFYPLFQAAYAELGTKKHFNDRVIEVIDIALASPEQTGPIKVAQPDKQYRYKFVDERLESMPAAQKALLRMGADNARAVKDKFRAIRERLVGLSQKK